MNASSLYNVDEDTIVAFWKRFRRIEFLMIHDQAFVNQSNKLLKSQ